MPAPAGKMRRAFRLGRRAAGLAGGAAMGATGAVNGTAARKATGRSKKRKTVAGGTAAAGAVVAVYVTRRGIRVVRTAAQKAAKTAWKAARRAWKMIPLPYRLLIYGVLLAIVGLVFLVAAAFNMMSSQAEEAQAAQEQAAAAMYAAQQAANGASVDDGCGSAGGASVSLPDDMDLEAVLASIRRIESGSYEGDYRAYNSAGGAAGAYQFLPGTWGGYGGYRSARDAPKTVQDARAEEHVGELVAVNEGAPWPVAVVLGWFIGPYSGGARDFVDLPVDDPAWDRPRDANSTTARQYLDLFQRHYSNWLGDGSGADDGDSGDDDGVVEVAACRRSPVVGDYALPIDRDLYERQGRQCAGQAKGESCPEGSQLASARGEDWFAKPHHDYPAADIPVGMGTEIYATAGGTVIGTTETTNACGVGLTIEDAAGVRYVYCHAQQGGRVAEMGDEVQPGELIMHSGNTGNSSGPHLHFGISTEVETATGHTFWQRHCPQLFLIGLYDGDPVDPATLPTTGCSYDSGGEFNRPQ